MRREGLTAARVEELARENILHIADTFTGFLDQLYEWKWKIPPSWLAKTFKMVFGVSSIAQRLKIRI